MRIGFKKILTENISAKIASLLAATAIWYVANYNVSPKRDPRLVGSELIKSVDSPSPTPLQKPLN
jgi:hypothetical protein